MSSTGKINTMPLNDSNVTSTSSHKLIAQKTPISMLEELGVSKNIQTKYDLIQTEGGSHNPNFTIRVTFGELDAIGSGPKKKEAKHMAAKAMLEKLDQQQLSVQESSDQQSSDQVSSVLASSLASSTQDQSDKGISDQESSVQGSSDHRPMAVTIQQSTSIPSKAALPPMSNNFGMYQVLNLIPNDLDGDLF